MYVYIWLDYGFETSAKIATTYDVTASKIWIELGPIRIYYTEVIIIYSLYTNGGTVLELGQAGIDLNRLRLPSYWT